MFILRRLGLLFCVVATVHADISVTPDVLGPGEGQQPPPGILIIDLRADVNLGTNGRPPDSAPKP